MSGSTNSSSSYASRRNSTLERRRATESRARLEALGHFVGLNMTAMPLRPRVHSSLSTMQDDSRKLHGTLSIDSIAAVVAQVAGPDALGPEAASGESETGRLLGRKPSLSGLSERSGASGASSIRSRNRGHSRSQARNVALTEQYARSHGYAQSTASMGSDSEYSVKGRRVTIGDVSTEPPISHHPSVLHAGPRYRKVASESGYNRSSSRSNIDAEGTNTNRRSTAACKEAQMTTPAMPEWAKPALSSTPFTALPPTPPIPQVLLLPEIDKENMGLEDIDGRRASTVTVTLETYTSDQEKPRSRSRAREGNHSQRHCSAGRSAGKSPGRISRSGTIDGDPRRACSPSSADTSSYMPHGAGSFRFDEHGRYLPFNTGESYQIQRQTAEQAGTEQRPSNGQQQRTSHPHHDCRGRGQTAQLERHDIPHLPPPKDPQQYHLRGHQRPPSLFIPPSQQPAKSFTVLAAKRTGTPPSLVYPYRGVSPTYSSSTGSTPGVSPTSHRGSQAGDSTLVSPLTPATPTATNAHAARPRPRPGGSRPRSPSPARGAYSPAVAGGERGVRARVEDAVQRFRRRSHHPAKRHAGLEPVGLEALELGRRVPQEDSASWQCPTRKSPLGAVPAPAGGGPSFAHRVAAAGPATSAAVVVGERNDGAPGMSSASSPTRTHHADRPAPIGRAYGPPAKTAPSPPVWIYKDRATTRSEQEVAELFVRGTTPERQSFLPFPLPRQPVRGPAQLRYYVPAHTSPALDADPSQSFSAPPTWERLEQFDFGFDSGHSGGVGAAKATASKAATPPPRVETPPSFVAVPHMQRSDSLFIAGGSDKKCVVASTRLAFFPPWTNKGQSASSASDTAPEGSAQSSEQLIRELPRDDRRGLPSQSQRQLRRREGTEFVTLRRPE